MSGYCEFCGAPLPGKNRVYCSAECHNQQYKVWGAEDRAAKAARKVERTERAAIAALYKGIPRAKRDAGLQAKLKAAAEDGTLLPLVISLLEGRDGL